MQEAVLAGAVCAALPGREPALEPPAPPALPVAFSLEEPQSPPPPRAVTYVVPPTEKELFAPLAAAP